MKDTALATGGLILLTLLLGACGGGDAFTDTSRATLTGTAATGAPVPSATVCVRAGATAATDPCDRQAVTDASGNYAVDVRGLQGPFVVTVEGLSPSGRPALLQSATEAVPGTGESVVVNVTPLTDAVVAAASTTAVAETGPGDLSAGAVADTSIELRGAITEVLAPLGVQSAEIDLIATPFAPDHSGIDRLFDLMDVTTSEDSLGGDVTVEVTVKQDPTQQIVVDNSGGSLAKDNASSTVIDTTALADAAALDVSGIHVLFDRVNAKLLAGNYAALQEEFFNNGADFLHDSETWDAYGSGTGFWVQTHQATGLAVLGTPAISGCDAAQEVCTVEYMETISQDAKVPFSVPVKQDAGGTWRFYGNQRAQGFSLRGYAKQQVDVATGTQTSVEHGIQLSNTDLSSATIARAVLKDDVGAILVEFKDCGAADHLSYTDATGTCIGGITTNMWPSARWSDRRATTVAQMAALNGRLQLELYDGANALVVSYANVALDAPIFAGTAEVPLATLTASARNALGSISAGESAIDLSWNRAPGTVIGEIIFEASDGTNSMRKTADLWRLVESSTLDLAGAWGAVSDPLTFVAATLVTRDPKGRNIYNEFVR